MFEIDEDIFQATRLFTQVEIRSNPKQLPDWLFSSAFDGRIYCKIAEVLVSERVDLKRQALLVLQDLLQKPDNAVRACRHGDLNLDGALSENVLLPTLVQSLGDTDTLCRISAAKCWMIFTTEYFGRSSSIVSADPPVDLLPALAVRLYDSDVSVRKLSYEILLKLCKHRPGGLQAVLEIQTEGKAPQRFLNLLVNNCLSEPAPAVQAAALSLCENIIENKVGWFEANQNGLIRCLFEVLQRSSDRGVLAIASLCVATFGTSIEGSRIAVKAGVISALAPLLDDAAAPLVREYSLRALMHLTTEVTGKAAAYDAGCVERCIALLSRPERRPATRSYTCLLVANMAEFPQVRYEDF